jgi:alcohol dehydrogenase (cytochrome c)
MAYTITMAPRVIKGGRIIIGERRRVRGARFLSAYDAQTGKLDWRFAYRPRRSFSRSNI